MAKLEYTKEQLSAIQQGSGTLLVAAGAGSGKTFMLTQRIAYLFSKDSGKKFGCPGSPAVSDIEQICAITFTEKAAQELKDRIRSKLFEIGLPEQALKVDSAWISTIHGTCSRILKAFAIDLDINPNFNIIINEQEQTLMQEAFDRAIEIYRFGEYGKEDKEKRNSKFLKLIKEYSLYGSFSADGVREMVFSLVGQANRSINGFKDISKLTPKEEVIPSGLEIFKNWSYECIQAVSLANDSLKKLEVLAKMQENIELANKHIKARDIKSFSDAVSFLEKCYSPPATFGNSEIKSVIKDYQDHLIYSSRYIMSGYANQYWSTLLDLSVLTKTTYDNLKFQKGCLDNNDLLTKTYNALSLCPVVKQEFQKKFKIVMVDEFQDASNLQISVISKLLGQNTSLNVVGDSQQSIYRFQGADISVFNSFKDSVCSNKNNGSYSTMSKNFRSNQNVLSFVEKIFSNREMFGKDFLRLSWCDGEHMPKTRDAGVAFVLACKEKKAKNIDVVCAKAQEIALSFKKLLKFGYKPNDMVLLLGKMTNAEVYASAFRDYGFDCVVASGSNLNSATEIQNIVCALKYFRNNEDTYSLFNLLHGAMFNVSLEHISSLFLRKNLGSSCANAIKIINECSCIARYESVAKAIRHLFVRSGWSARLETQGASGYAKAANILKAARIIFDLEDNNTEGFYSNCCKCIELFGDYAKNTPGTLNISDTNAVKIMTIHSSKGLEFPVVAVADFDSPKSNNRLLLETIQNNTIGSLNPGSMFASKYSNTKKMSSKKLNNKENFESSDGVLANRADLQNLINDRESAEDMRKLYVGLTRAKEVVILAAECIASSKGDLKFSSETCKGIVHSLLGFDFSPVNCKLDSINFGGTENARFTLLHVNTEENSSETSEPKLSNFFTIQSAPFPRFTVVPTFEKFDDLVSYTSLKDDNKSNYVAFCHVEEGESCIFEAGKTDKDHATEFGSAFHEIAQYETETGIFPDKKIINGAIVNHRLDDSLAKRLIISVESWFGSELFSKTRQFKKRLAEVPFCIPYDNDKFLHGAIDLICINGDSILGSDVMIIDYKTGGHYSETKQSLYKKHIMQAQCYAEAVKYAGARYVKVVFVRVEQGCQTVVFEF